MHRSRYKNLHARGSETILEPAKKKGVFFTASKYPGLDSYSGDRQGEWGIARAVHQREQQAIGRCSNASSRQGWPLWPIINYGATPTQNPHPGPNPPWGFWDGKRRVWRTSDARDMLCGICISSGGATKQLQMHALANGAGPHTCDTSCIYFVWSAALNGGDWPPTILYMHALANGAGPHTCDTSCI